MREKAGIFTGVSYEAAAFLKEVRAACDGRLPRGFVDGGTWYPRALNKIGFKRFTVVAFGHRSAIERFFGDIERRIRRFWCEWSLKLKVPIKRLFKGTIHLLSN